MSDAPKPESSSFHAHPSVGVPHGNRHTDRPIDPLVLRRVLERAAQTGARGLVLFDLDSTLLDNKPRQARILREFGAAAAVPELANCQAAHFVDWSLATPMCACGLSAQRAAELEPQARRFWLERFFTSEYCVDDIANPGAVEYVRQTLDAGSSILYCTGRHEEMREGTLRCFAREGFPQPDHPSGRVHLLMKPNFEMHDDEWKVVARDHISSRGELLAAFDNEPTHINSYHEFFPSALSVHLLTDDSARGVKVLPTIPSIHNFKIA